MKKYTQADVDAIERDENGWRYMPKGEYDEGVYFGDKCVIAEDSILSEGCAMGDYCLIGDYSKLSDFCALGNNCKIGDHCELGDGCRLGDRCELGDDCKLGNNCELGNACRLGNRCELGDGCRMGDRCEMGDWCKLGDRCGLGVGCKAEGGKVEIKNYIKIGPIGSRGDTAYFYKGVSGGVFVRAGCWFGGADDFERQVKEVHQGTRHERDYLAALEFAKAVLQSEP